MSDAGHIATNDILANIEDKIQNVYEHANKDMHKKVDVKLKKYQSELPKKQAELSKEDFETWKKNQAYIMLNQQNVADTLADDLVNHDKIAASIINEHTSSVYALNYNFGTYQIESDMDMSTSFALYDQHTVERLLKDDPDLLPHVDIDSSKDKRWNKRHINDALIQGILQGESVPKIAKRLSDTVRMDKNAAIRNARTATTGAQNAGRVDSYKRAQNMGIDLQQEWMATLDGRTRHSHRAIDGERVGVGEMFSNKCHYPGDPTGPAHEVYNCRCTLVPVIKGYELDNSWKQDVSIEGMSYDEWKNAHKTVEQVQKVNVSKTKTMRDITESTKSTLKTAYVNHSEMNKLNNTSVQDLSNDFISVNYGKMSEKSAMAFDKALSELTQKYDTPLYKVRLMDKMEYVGHRNSFAFTYHDYETDVATLVINPGKCGDYEKFTDRIKELMESGYAAKVDDNLIDRYVMTHEFGHSLLDMGSELNNKRNWVNADYKKIKNARKEVAKIYDDYMDELKKIDSERKSAEMSFMINFDEKAGEKARKLGEELKEIQVSKYSLTNADEFLAECFTASELGKSKNKYVLQIMDVLNKYFKR